ncbi:MAG: 2-phosphosulfolactate phosphatase [Planctomycetia bacterium]|nr:2-phosphosulfolactate phosphatase [Planctomycetia bacterium]
MSRPIYVHAVSALFEPAELRNGVAVVIDVLRATSTITHALAAGARCVIPCGEVEEARRRRDAFLPASALLGGERQGLRIPGFDLGNSPAEYLPETVRGKSVVFTTTNGTQALIRARDANRVLIGALLNVGAVAATLAGLPEPIHLVCAGLHGQLALEDLLFAGAIAHRLQLAAPSSDFSEDATQLALNLYETCGRDYDRAASLLRSSRGGRNLIECGLEADIGMCAREDSLALVPELFKNEWEIRDPAGQ